MPGFGRTLRQSRIEQSMAARRPHANVVAKIYMLPAGPERDAALAALDEANRPPVTLDRRLGSQLESRLTTRRRSAQ
jgi:hypothetical protein